MAERELTDEEALALGLHERELTDEEAAALGLHASPQSLKQKPAVGAGETFLNRAIDALPLGRPATNVLSTGGLQLAKALGVGSSNVHLTAKAKQEMQERGMAVPSEENAIPGVLDTYRDVRDTRNERTEAGSEQNKWAGRAGTALGIGLTLPLAARMGLGSGLLGAAATGGAYGGLFGLTHGRADLTKGEFAQGARDVMGVDALLQAKQEAEAGNYGRAALNVVGAGAVGGGLTGAALHGAARATTAPVGYAWNKTKGYVTPTPEAQRLAQEGVELTLGQMDPKSTFGRIENLAANKSTGGTLAVSRQKAAASARDALLRKAGAVGEASPTAGTRVFDQLDELKAGYGSAYDKAIGQSLVNGQSVRQAFGQAAQNPNVIASPADRQLVAQWLDQQAQSLEQGVQTGGTIRAADLQKLRSELRSRASEMLSGNPSQSDRAKAEMVQEASDFVTKLFDNQLSPQAAAKLRGTDATYRNLKSVQSAADRAFVQDGAFTPAQALQAIRANGATPDVEALARNAHSVLSAEYPLTGIQAAANDHIPLLKQVGPTWAGLANSSPTLRAHALGRPFVSSPGMTPTRLTQAIIEARTPELRELALQRALADALRRKEQTDAVAQGTDFAL